MGFSAERQTEKVALLIICLLHLLSRSLRPRHHILQRSLALLFQLRTRQRLARQHQVAHRRVVDKDCLNHRRLSQIIRLQPLIRIHVGVMGARSVIEHVLNKLESRHSDRIERFVIGAARISHRQRAHTQVLQWRDPLLKDRSD